VLDDGRKVTRELFRSLLAEELAKVKDIVGDEAWNAAKYEDAAKLVRSPHDGRLRRVPHAARLRMDHQRRRQNHDRDRGLIRAYQRRPCPSGRRAFFCPVLVPSLWPAPLILKLKPDRHVDRVRNWRIAPPRRYKSPALHGFQRRFVEDRRAGRFATATLFGRAAALTCTRSTTTPSSPSLRAIGG
jgi:hypothetical protein